MPKAPVRKRCFVQMTGYEPVGPDHQHRRFIREMGRFLKAWNLQGKVSPPSITPEVASWTVETWGPNWRVVTDFHQFRWDQFIVADAAASDWLRIPLGIAALMEFVLTGTAVRYFRTAWRYAFFFLSPFAYILGMLWLSIGLTRLAMGHLGLPFPLVLAPVLCLAVFIGLRFSFGRMMHIRYALDDWYFARDFIHRVRPEVEERLDRLAEVFLSIVRATDADEIIFDGHSLGAPLSIIVLDRALKLDPTLGGKPLHLVSSGSSLLKLALHPAAGWIRDAVGRVVKMPQLFWVEYQALVDVINTYNVDPVVACGLPFAGKPLVKIIRIRLMLEESTYRRFRLSFLRIHRQAVMGNERRYFYDYYMLCCGPIALTERVENPDDAVAVFAADGTLSDAAPPRLAVAGGNA
ncbi:MAG TPA: hypothetical protein VH206_00835 [Xanthobacteraceae bacterium]|jgi:hypothetical protein|nr:hypothetical protein [Xanthobacteraceae bacterium]